MSDICSVSAFPVPACNAPIHALIVSAGRGSRFGADVPKQYLTVAGRTVLEHSVSCLNVTEITDLTLVIAKDDEFASSLAFAFDKPIHFATGGAERFLSVKAGVESIIERTGCDGWVLIHDGARPCLPCNDLQKLIQTVQNFANQNNPSVGAILATPVADTLKLAQTNRADGLAVIDKTVSREHLWQAQTPQLFGLYALNNMLSEIIQKQLIITDEASGFEQLGQSVAIVQGSRTNIKLTYPDDIRLVELILQDSLT